MLSPYSDIEVSIYQIQIYFRRVVSIIEGAVASTQDCQISMDKGVSMDCFAVYQFNFLLVLGQPMK